MKRIKKVFIIILIISLLVAGFFLTKKISMERRVESLSSNIKEQINNISELSTIKYNYTNIAEYKDNLQFSGINIPFSSKGYLVKYSGYIKAGIDLSQVEIEVIGTDKAEVILPESEIMENVISEEDVYFYNEKDSAFNKLKFDDLYTLLKDEKQKTEKELIDKGLLNDADENAMITIRLMLESLGIVQVVFK